MSELVKLSQQIQEQLTLFSRNYPGINIQMMMKDITIESKIIGLIKVLEEKEIITSDEVNLKMSETILDMLKQIKISHAKQDISTPGKGLLIPGKFGEKK